MPSRRRSTIAIEPMTTLRASTWTHSIQGKSVSPSRMAVEIELSCSVCRNCSNTSASLNVGDPSSSTDDGYPKRNRGQGDELAGPPSRGRHLPERGTFANGQLTRQGDARCNNEQCHLQQKHGVFQGARRLCDDENGACSQQHWQRPPDEWQESLRHAR